MGSRDEIFKQYRRFLGDQTPWGKLNLESYQTRNELVSKGRVEAHAVNLQVEGHLMRNLLNASPHLKNTLRQAPLGERHCLYRAYKAEYWPNFREYRNSQNAGASGEFHVKRWKTGVKLSGKYVCWDKQFESEFQGKLDTILENCLYKEGHWYDNFEHIEGNSSGTLKF